MTTATKKPKDKTPAFRPRPGYGLSKEKATRYGVRLYELADANAGELTPELVLEEAAGKKSPLHDWFTWDTKRAVHQNLLNEARQLMRAVVVIVDKRGKKTTCPALHSYRVQVKGVGRGGVRAYVKTIDVIEDVDIRALVIEQVRKHLNSARRLARQLEDFGDASGFFRIVSEAETELDGLATE